MIVKMSKYAFMVYHKEYDEFLERLRGMGVVHIQENVRRKRMTVCNSCWPNENVCRMNCVI